MFIKGNIVNRTLNFIGRSNWYNYGDQNADAVYDDIKIFDRAFNSTDIINDYNSKPVEPELQAASDNASAPFYYDYHMNNIGGIALNDLNSTSIKYINCFGDRIARDLDGIYIDNFNINSPTVCAQTCSQFYFHYAGVQNAYQCWCGDSYNRYGRAANCFLECPGNTDLICGGQYSNNVYEITNYSKLF